MGRGCRIGPLGDRPPRQLFKGKFYYCEGADTRNISTKAECRAAHYRWVRRKYNFDNLGQVGGEGRGQWGGGRAVQTWSPLRFVLQVALDGFTLVS